MNRHGICTMVLCVGALVGVMFPTGAMGQSQPSTKGKATPIAKDLADYFQDARQLGLNNDELRLYAIRAGWKPNVVDEVLKTLPPTPSTGEPAKPEKDDRGVPDEYIIGDGAAGLSNPASVAVDGNFSIIVADTNNSRIVVYPSLIGTQPSGTSGIYALGGSNQNGLATPSSLISPIGLFLDRKNTLYVGDTGNNRVVQYLNSAITANAAVFVLFANGNVPVAPGSLATLKVTPVCLTLSLPCLAPGQTGTGSAPLPPSLAGWQVAVNDTLPTPLYYVGPDSTGVGQVNLQVPGATPAGSNRIAVKDATTGELIAGGPFSVASIGPALFAANSQGTGQGSILNQDGVTTNGAAHPAPRGSVVSLFGTGPGPVTSPVADGQPPATLTSTNTAPAADTQSCLAQSAICVVFGTNVFGNVQFSGLAPGFVGLWQINVQIPTSARRGTRFPFMSCSAEARVTRSQWPSNDNELNEKEDKFNEIAPLCSPK